MHSHYQGAACGRGALILTWWYIQRGNSWSYRPILLPTAGDLGNIFSWLPKPGINGFGKPESPPSLFVFFCFFCVLFSLSFQTCHFSCATHKAGNTPPFPGSHQMGPASQNLATSPCVSIPNFLRREANWPHLGHIHHWAN